MAYRSNLVPLWHSIERLHKPKGEHYWPYYIGYWGNLFGNIILFLPFGIMLSYLYPVKRGKVILLYGFLTSIGIELTQLLLQIGVCDIDDVLLNVSGTAVGIYVYQIVKKRGLFGV